MKIETAGLASWVLKCRTSWPQDLSALTMEAAPINRRLQDLKKVDFNRIEDSLFVLLLFDFTLALVLRLFSVFCSGSLGRF